MKKETHAKGEGSTKRAIRRGLELFSESKRGGPSSSSSSSGLTSVIVILSLASTPSFVGFRAPLKKRQVGFALEDWKGGNLTQTGAEKQEEEEETEEEQVVALEKGRGREREGFIEREVEVMLMND